MKSAKEIRDLTDQQLLFLMEHPEKYSPGVLGMEYLRRAKQGTDASIRQPGEIAALLKSHWNKKQECFFAVLFDGAHHVISVEMITKGIANKTIVHPREVFRKAILKNAVAIVVAHNHPSGNVSPSIEDITITNRLKDAGEIIGIKVIDHVIFCRNDYYSLLEHKEL